MRTFPMVSSADPRLLPLPAVLLPPARPLRRALLRGARMSVLDL